MKYFIAFFKFIFTKLGIFGKFMFRFGAFLPLGVFLITQLIIDLIKADFLTAIYGLATTVFAAEMNINTVTHAAIANADSYDIWSFASILISIYILYALVNFFTKIQVGVSGSQAVYGAIFLSIIVVAILEVSAIAVIDGSYGFIPFYHGIFFLIKNINPVIFNIFGEAVVTSIANNVTNSTLLNTTFT